VSGERWIGLLRNGSNGRAVFERVN